MKNNVLDTFLKKSIFGGKMGVAAEQLTHRVELLGQPSSQEKVFKNLGLEPPLISTGIK